MSEVKSVIFLLFILFHSLKAMSASIN